MSQESSQGFYIFFHQVLPQGSPTPKSSAPSEIQKQRRAVGHSIHLPTERSCNRTAVTGASRKHRPSPKCARRAARPLGGGTTAASCNKSSHRNKASAPLLPHGRERGGGDGGDKGRDPAPVGNGTALSSGVSGGAGFAVLNFFLPVPRQGLGCVLLFLGCKALTSTLAAS